MRFACINFSNKRKFLLKLYAMKENNNKKVDTANYKGVRDFYPDDMFVQDYIMSVWHHVLESYGYEHYSASILEPTEIYEGKTSDEIVSEQTYNFTDRGGRRITLRPEMTPTVARMVAKKRREMAFPLRWYSIPNVFRYERPQKGRLREHWQLNVDMFGIESVDAEAEIIDIAYNIMSLLGLKEKDFEIKVSDRAILNQLMENLGLDDSKQKDFKRLLDKKSKIPADEFEEKMTNLIGQKLDLNISPNVAVSNLISKLDSRGIKNVKFDPTLTRGFDYYTGIVFEIFDTNPENNRSMFGGGRYDNLMEVFGEEKLPTVGFGMGDVTVRDALDARGLLPKKPAPAHLFICTMSDSARDYASEMANYLRKGGVDTVVNYEDKKVGDQIKKADKNHIPFVICVGDSEISKEKFKIKDLRTGKEKVVKKNAIAKFVSDNILG
jgi:histidyl-tRNA synthetase